MKPSQYHRNQKAPSGVNMFRRSAKRDYSEPEIIAALTQVGFSVYQMQQPVDLLVGFRGKNYLVECKTEGTAYGKALNDSQQLFDDTWRGSKIVTLRSAQDAIDWAEQVCGGEG